MYEMLGFENKSVKDDLTQESLLYKHISYAEKLDLKLMKALLTGTESDFICYDKSGVFEKVIVAVASQNLTIDYIKFIVEQY